MFRRRLFVVAFLLAAIGIACHGGGTVSATRPPGRPIAQDLASLVQTAPLVLVGRVVDVQLGRVAGQGEARLQFNDVQVRMEKPLKGKPAAVIIVELVAAPRGEVLLGIGPPYRRGERYLLFLRPGEAPRYIAIHQGRYLLKDVRVWPTQAGPVADSAKGKATAKFIAEIEAIVASQP